MEFEKNIENIGTAYLSLDEYDKLKSIEREYDDDHTFRVVCRGEFVGESDWCDNTRGVFYLGKDEVLRRLTCESCY